MSCWNGVPAARDAPLALADSIEGGAVMVVLGVIVLLAIVVPYLKFSALVAGGESTDHERLVNCPSCGARIPAEADACEYCGDRVDR